MRTLLLSIAASLFICAIGTAAQNDSIPLLHHEISISASTISGIGISYRYNFNNQFYLKTIGMAYYTEDNTLRSHFLGIVGLELQHNLTQTQNSRLYGFIGSSYWYTNYQSVYKSVPEFTRYETINIGAGLGFEFFLWEHLTVNLNFGFQHEGESLSSSSEYFNPTYTPYSRFGMGGGVSIGYQF
jgi:hypothetical protein